MWTQSGKMHAMCNVHAELQFPRGSLVNSGRKLCTPSLNATIKTRLLEPPNCTMIVNERAWLGKGGKLFLPWWQLSLYVPSCTFLGRYIYELLNNSVLAGFQQKWAAMGFFVYVLY